MKKIESIEFADALFSAGTYCSVTCDFCGRIHFCSESYGEWTDEEDDKKHFDALVKGCEEEPDGYVECDYTIRFGVIDGKTGVEGCPCGELKKYEDWIWNHRFVILDYLGNRHRSQKLDVDYLGKQLKDTSRL